MHLLVGVFVPDEMAHDGPQVVVDFTAAQMQPYSERLQVAPHKVHPSNAEIERMASYHGVPTDDLHQLAEAIMQSDGDAGDEDEVIVPDVVSAGVDENGLFCISVFNDDAWWDWYKIGGRYYGDVTGCRKPCPKPHSPLQAVKDNIAPVDEVLGRVIETGRPLFYDFLTPEKKWYAMPSAGISDEEFAQSWRIAHLRPFRSGHHVLGIDFHF